MIWAVKKKIVSYPDLPRKLCGGKAEATLATFDDRADAVEWASIAFMKLAKGPWADSFTITIERQDGEALDAEAFRMFGRWRNEHDPEGNMDVIEASSAYHEWAQKNSVEKYLDASQGQ